MAAALRSAARKVCGRALKHRQVVYSALVSRAVEEEPRRLSPKLIRGEMPRPSNSLFYSSVASDPPGSNKHNSPSCKKSIGSEESGINNFDSESLEQQIQEKKEELFSLLLKRPSGKECAQLYKELLQLLDKSHELKFVEFQRERTNKAIAWSVLVAFLLVVQYKFMG